MRTKFILSILVSKTSLFCLLVFFLLSCNKIDNGFTNSTEKFFSISSSTPKEVVRCVNELKRQNAITGFVEDLANKEGFAYWDKSFINHQSSNIPTLLNLVSSNGDTLVFIPLVQQGEESVNGFLLFRINGSISTYLYRANDYDEFSYGEIDSESLKSENVVLMLLKLDESIFGKRKFDLTDPLLFKSWLTQNDTVRNVPISIEYNKVASSWDWVDLCYDSYHCENRCPAGECDFCSACFSIICGPYPVYNGGGPYTWPPDDPPASGGGSGGGSPCPTCPPPPPNCTGSGNCSTSGNQIVNGIIPCGGCGNGPIIILPVSSDDPCPQANNAAQKMNLLYESSGAGTVIAGIPNISTEPNERGFAVTKKKVVDPNNPASFIFNNYSCGPIQTGTPSSIIIDVTLGYLQHTAAFVHIHPSGGFAAQSAKDIYMLIKDKTDNQYLEGNIVHAYNGDQYAITITDPIAAQTFYNTMSSNLDATTNKWNTNSAIGVSFNLAEEYYLKLYKGNPNKENLAYEMAMATVLSEFNAGVTLNKKDANGNFKPIIINTSIPDPSKPKKKVYTQICN